MKRIYRHLLLTVFAALSVSLVAIEVVYSESSAYSQASKVVEPTVSADIDSEIFSESVPRRMIVGETYVIALAVTNTGDADADFSINLHFPFQTSVKYFYTQCWSQNLTLYPGESQRVKFYLTPVSTHTGPLTIVGNLYSLSQDEAVLVDSVSATVYEIRTALSIEKTIWIMEVVVFFLFIAFAIIFLKKPAVRREFIIAFMLFFGALLLRAPNLLRVAIYPDEITFRMLGWDVLHNNWVWRKSLMWAGYPPLYFYLYAASTYLFGSGDLEAIRAVSAIAGSLTVVTTYFLGKSLYGKKVGLLSALFLCFFPLHILYSRIAMTEVLMLFFMTTSAYFFWIGYRKKSWTHMCVSGIFLGLSLNTKYIAAVSLVASVLFVVWVGRSWKPLLRRDFLVWLATTLVVIAPVQLKLLQNRINPYWWYLSQAFSPKPLLPGWRSLSLLEFVPRSLRLQVYVSARVASPWLPWLSGYELAIVVLFLASVLYFVPLSLKAKVNPSFLMLFFIIPLSFFAINPWRGAGLSWLVYPLPYYFIMLSSFTVHFLCSLRTVGVSPSTVAKGLKKNSHFLKVFLLTLTVIFGFSNVVVGLTAPIIDKGEIEGARLAMLYIKNRVNQGDAISGWWLSYYLYYINTYNLNVTFVSLEKVSLRSLIKAQRSELALTFREFVLNEHVLTTLKPRFIIISRAYLGFFFNESMKEVLLSNYELVWFGRPYIGYFWGPEETNFQTWLVFERKT